MAAGIGLMFAALRRGPVLIVSLCVLLQQVIFAAVPVPSYRWYYTPLIMVVQLLCFVAGLEILLRLRSVVFKLVPIAVSVLLVLSYWGQVPRTEDPREGTYLRIARALSVQKEGASIACSEIGTLGAYLPLSWKVVDLSGLTTKPLLSAPQNRDLFWRAPTDYFVLHWFQDRVSNPQAYDVMMKYDLSLGRGTPFGSEIPFLLDRRFYRTYRLISVNHTPPYAKLIVFERRS